MRAKFILIRLGRLLLASLFILAGISKAVDPASAAGQLRALGFEPAVAFVYLAAVFEVGAGIAVNLSGRASTPAALALVAYTLAVNWFFHAFWLESGREAALQLSLFFKNLSICGALLFLAGHCMISSEDG